MDGKENGINAEHTPDAAQSDPLLSSSRTQPSRDSASAIRDLKAELLPRSSEDGQTKSQSPPTEEKPELRTPTGDSSTCASDHFDCSGRAKFKD